LNSPVDIPLGQEILNSENFSLDKKKSLAYNSFDFTKPQFGSLVQIPTVSTLAREPPFFNIFAQRTWLKVFYCRAKQRVIPKRLTEKGRIHPATECL